MHNRRTAEVVNNRSTSESTGRNPGGYERGAESISCGYDPSTPTTSQLLEQVVEQGNMRKAWQQVKRNGGIAGIDGRSIADTQSYLQQEWPKYKMAILDGTYRPQPVFRVEIPKPSGGVRKLGIPTVLDRLVQQAVSQILTPLFDPEFSHSSYGFRPGRSAHDAVLQARRYQQEGKRWVIDMDLAKFFDEVNHDVLMARIGRKVKDKRLKRLISHFLKAGYLWEGTVHPTDKGTPQGGPLSPLLSNILLDDLDKELERRGHQFCRYSDDCNIYVGSRRAGERVLVSISRYVEDVLKLKVNHAKSAVDRPWRRKFLGYSFTNHHSPRIRVPKSTVHSFRKKLKLLFRAGRGRNMGRFIVEDLNPVLRGWIEYFSLTEVKGFAEDLDKWIRRRFRLIIWRQWKRYWTRYCNMVQRGLDEGRARLSALNGRGPWWNSGSSHMNQTLKAKYFDSFGLLSLLRFLVGVDHNLFKNRRGT